MYTAHDGLNYYLGLLNFYNQAPPRPNDVIDQLVNVHPELGRCVQRLFDQGLDRLEQLALSSGVAPTN